MNNKIYVGDSPWSFKGDEFKELFEEPGKTKSVKIMVDRMSGRSRGFGFVESKAISAIEFLINGAKNGETGCYICVTEPSSKILSNLQTYDSFDDSLVKEGKLNIFDLTVINDRLGLDETSTYTTKDMEDLLGAFEDIVDELGTALLVIESITAICHHLPDEESIRYFIFRLSQLFKTTLFPKSHLMLILESGVDSSAQIYSIFAVPEPDADEIYDMGNVVVGGEGDLLRSLQIVSGDVARNTLLRKTDVNMDSKSEGGPYSRVEQLEKLIELRNKGEITPEEFEEMKKEIMGK